MKQYKCEKCNYNTNSGNEWLRHTKSKDHKDNYGIIKQTYFCEVCNFTSNFPARFKEHCNTNKHKTRITYRAHEDQSGR